MVVEDGWASSLASGTGKDKERANQQLEGRLPGLAGGKGEGGSLISVGELEDEAGVS